MIENMNIQRVSLKDYSSLRIGGEGDLVVVTNEDELKDAVAFAKQKHLRVYILGGGTNTYFADDLSGYLFVKPEFLGIHLNGEILTARAGENWDDVVKFTVDNGLWGIENLSHIPGGTGAGPIQNIGAYGVELKDTLVSVRVFDMTNMEFLDLLNTDCEFGYRDSIFKHQPGRYVVISIILKLSNEPQPVLTYKPLDTLIGKENLTIADIRDLVIKTRDIKLPDWKVFPNTGSFFKNPIVEKSKVDELKEKYPEIKIFDFEDNYKVSAAWLIENVAEAKGKREGDVGTWPNQPLVLVNYGNATSSELNAFADAIQNKIESETGVRLDREVNFVQ